MSDLKISELLDGGSAQLTDQIAIARAGGSYELTLGEVKILILGTLATDVSNNATAITDLQNDRLKLDGSNGPMTGNLDMGAYKITSTYVPAADADLVNRKYVTDNYLPLSGGTMAGAITLHSTGTPASGSEPISYTFAEATYAKATGTLNFVARFSPDGTTLDESTIRDDGSNASINGTIDSSSQLKIISSETNALLLDATGSKAINISQTGTGADKFGVFISATGTNASNYFGIMADVNNAGSGKSYGALLNSTTSQGAAFGLEVDVTTRGDGNTGIELTGVHVDGVRVNTGDSADNAYGVLIDGISGAGTVTNAYNFYGAGISTTTATDVYGLYLADHISGTNKWGIYQAGDNDENRFNGVTGFGTDPTSSAYVYIKSESGEPIYGLLVSQNNDNIGITYGVVAENTNHEHSNHILIHSAIRGAATPSSTPTEGGYIGGYFSYGTLGDQLYTASPGKSNGYAVMAQAYADEDTTTVFGFALEKWGVQLGNTVGALYGLYITDPDIDGTLSTTPYGIYQTGSSLKNSFYGSMGIGGDASSISQLRVDSNVEYGVYVEGDSNMLIGVYAEPDPSAGSVYGGQFLASGTGTANNTGILVKAGSVTHSISGAKGAIICSTGIDGTESSTVLELIGRNGVPGTLTGISMDIEHNTTGAVTTVQGIDLDVKNDKGNTTTNLTGISIKLDNQTGTVSNGRALYIETIAGTISTPYAIYQEGANDPNYFAGETGIGASPVSGSALTIGTTGGDTEIIEASTTGTSSTRNGWIRIEVGGTTRYIPLYESV